MNGATELELAVINKLVAGAHPALAALRAQAEVSGVRDREYTGVGFWTFFNVPDDAAPTEPADFLLDDVEAEIVGLAHGAGFGLMVKNGRLEMLEGFTYDEPWPEEANDFVLRYTTEPREFQLVRMSGED